MTWPFLSLFPRCLQKSMLDTVKRILRKAGLHGRVVAKKLLLNRGHIKKRLLWCKLYLEMDVGSWRNFIFSGEARLELYSKRRQYVRRSVGQRFQSKYTLKTVKYGGPSILLWGAIRGDGAKVFCRCPPILNSKDYQTVLDRYLCWRTTPYLCKMGHRATDSSLHWTSWISVTFKRLACSISWSKYSQKFMVSFEEKSQ